MTTAQLTQAFELGQRVVAVAPGVFNGDEGRAIELTHSPSGNGAYVRFTQMPEVGLVWFGVEELQPQSAATEPQES